MSFTPEALQQQQKIKVFFPSLVDNYQPYMGNFCFTPDEFITKIRVISEWMKEFTDFRIVIEEGEFFLTDI